MIDYIHTRPLLSRWRFIKRVGECFLSKKELSILNIIKGCDAVFVKGGGFIHSYGSVSDPYYVYFQTYHIRLAKELGKRVIVLPNSIGPLNNAIARRVALKSLRKCDLVTVRENISRDYLNQHKLNAEYYPDLGFFLKPATREMGEYLTGCGVPVNRKKVIITLRPYRFPGSHNARVLFDNYINAFVSFTNFLHERGFFITFMAHTLGPSSHEDDRIAIASVMSRLPESVLKEANFIEDYELNCREIEKLYSYYDYMIGTRFHSVIFSLNVGVPAIAIAYGGNKGKGIMDVLENGAYSIDMDKVTQDRLIGTFKSLELHRSEYLTNLRVKRDLIETQRNDLVVRIRGKLDCF